MNYNPKSFSQAAEQNITERLSMKGPSPYPHPLPPPPPIITPPRYFPTKQSCHLVKSLGGGATTIFIHLTLFKRG